MEMPNDPNADRFIEGQDDTEIPDEASMDIFPEDNDVEEMPDGTAVFTMSEYKGPSEDEDFYSNLAETLEVSDLSALAMRYLDLIDKDKQAREQRDKQYEEGLRRTGLGNDAPGGANFMGASKVVHPVMAEACVDFAARAIKEMFPPGGPVRTNIIGEATDDKTEVAERKRDYMNWQLTDQIVEFRDEQEQLLTQLPLGGSQFMKLWWDDKKRRPCAEFVAIDNILLPFAAANFYIAQRVTEVQDISDWEFENRVDRGLYRDVETIRSALEPEQTLSEKANQKIEGKQFQDGEDGLRRVYHIYTWLELEDDTHSMGESAPYIMMVDEINSEVIGLYRNWEQGDETMDKLDWLVEFKFIPWRGAYAIGLPHLIGGLSAALTGALRALLDSAHINNAATMLKLKGARISGQTQQVEVTQVAEIEGAPGVDDIRKIAMSMPFNPPSPVLFQLLGWLTGAAKGVVTTAEEKIADINANAPVGTTQALIEQGSAVFSSIHSRLHDSQKRVLGILQRINRWYLDDQRRGDVVAELEIKMDDFKRNTDVIPVSDPHIFSETQRMAQMQAVLSMMDKYPQLFDPRAVVGRMLKQIKVPNIPELMPQYTKPMELNAADENASMALGRPATAYPPQDHIAHLEAHLAFAIDPVLGANPIIAPEFVPAVLDHVKQHMMLWYTQRMDTYAEGEAGVKKEKYENVKDIRGVDRAMALASHKLTSDTQAGFQQFMPIIGQLMQTAQQLAPKPPQDPDSQAMLQASAAETQRRAARDQADIGLKKLQLQQEDTAEQRKEQIQAAMNSEDNLTEERIRTLQLSLDAAKVKKEQEESAIALNENVQKNLEQSR